MCYCGSYIHRNNHLSATCTSRFQTQQVVLDITEQNPSGHTMSDTLHVDLKGKVPHDLDSALVEFAKCADSVEVPQSGESAHNTRTLMRADAPRDPCVSVLLRSTAVRYMRCDAPSNVIKERKKWYSMENCPDARHHYHHSYSKI
jgi:hypothetical protein